MGLKEIIPIDLEYPVPLNTSDYRPNLSVIASDWIMFCSARNAVRSVVNGNSPVWYYIFDKVASFGPEVWAPDYYCYDAVCHGSELPFVFHSCSNIYNYTQSETHLSLSMVQYWAGLAHGNETYTLVLRHGPLRCWDYDLRLYCCWLCCVYVCAVFVCRWRCELFWYTKSMACLF